MANKVEICGVNTARLPLLKAEEKPLNTYPNIPWQAIYGMRNMISHEYANVDEVIVYDTIKNELPELKNIIEDLLSQY